MITVHLDGVQLAAENGSRLKDIYKDRDPDCCVAVIRPATQEAEETGSFLLKTSSGEVGIETTDKGVGLPNLIDLEEELKLHWSDRYAAAFGPFSSVISPDRTPHLYERGDIVLGCGGYDPKRSYLIFCKMRHFADFGAGEDGGVVARVVSGRGIVDRWTTGDAINAINPVVSWADISRSFTSYDDDLVLEDGMEIITHAAISACGYSPDHIETGAAYSVEHLLRAMQTGHFVVGRNTSTHIRDERAGRTEVPLEISTHRREGTVTVRTRGSSQGSVYMYTADVPRSPAHTTVGQVTHGSALARLAKKDDVFCVRVRPERFDLVGMPFGDAMKVAEARGIDIKAGSADTDAIVVLQKPDTTLESLAGGSVSLTTVALEKVIDISLDDKSAPASCDIFRRMTGLHLHSVGSMPYFFNFEDVYLFKPDIRKGTSIVPENTPTEVVPAGSLAITNDSRKGSGMVGVRLTENKEFGPTSEPFEGTNMIGCILDQEKIRLLKEKEIVYIREVNP